jgi:acyl-CoA synthetase (AMP-forming)/AMP-acid ligase II
VIVNPETSAELPDGQVGEIWLQGNNVGRGYWGRPDETLRTFGVPPQSRLEHDSHAAGAADGDKWLRTGDLGVYLDGELYVTGRIADMVVIGGVNHYPQDIETTTAEASPMVRRGYVAAFTDNDERLVIIANARRAPSAPTRSRRSTRSKWRFPNDIGSPSPRSACCPPEPFRARPVASWPGEPAAQNISAVN